MFLRTCVWTGFLIEWLISAAQINVSKRFIEQSFTQRSRTKSIRQGQINERDYWWSTHKRLYSSFHSFFFPSFPDENITENAGEGQTPAGSWMRQLERNTTQTPRGRTISQFNYSYIGWSGLHLNLRCLSWYPLKSFEATSL